MGFLQNLFKNRTKHADITICGLDDAGKTTILRYLETGQFIETTPTMGVNRETLHLPGLQINVFDLARQEDFHNMWHSINEKSDGIVFVVDRANAMRFHEAKNVFRSTLNAQLDDELVLLVLLNKSDVQDVIDKSAFITDFGLQELPFKWGIFETSAKTGQGIFNAFKWFVDEFIR
jgi:small GTP-binding protein